MTTLLSLFVASLRRFSSRLRARLARKLAALSKGAARLLASGVPGGLAQRLCQVAVACGLAAMVAGGIGAVVHAGGGGGTFRVSDRSAFIEKRPSVARDADGDYVVVWQSWYRDGPGYGVYARRYNSADQPKGPSFRINSSTSNWERNPAVAMDRDGDFVVVWQDYDANSYGIKARLFDKDGAPRTGEFLVNTYQSSYQVQPDVAMDADGNFVVTWSSYFQVSSSASWDVYARRFTADGTPASGEFLVNQTISFHQHAPAIAADDAGNFVVVWSSQNNGGTNYDVFRRRYAADGTPLENEQRVNFYTSGDQVLPDVAMDQDGDFVVVWQGEGQTYNYSFSSSYDYDASGVFGRRFDAGGSPLNGDFRVNQFGTGAQFDAKVAMDADGNFVVAFVDDDSGGGSWSYNIYARRFHAVSPLNNPVSADGGNFTVFSSYYATACDVAMDADGDFVIVGNQAYYSSNYSHYTGGSYSAYFQIRAYSNRFEGNGTSAAPTVAGVFLRDDLHHVSAGESLARHFQSLVVSFSREMDAADIENTGNWSLTRNGSNVPVQSVLYYYNPMLWRYEALVYFGHQPQGDGNYVLTLNGGIEGENGEVMGANFSLDFRVRTPKARGNNLDVAMNTIPSSGIWEPAVARDADGDFVVAWHEYYNGEYQVLARRYNAAGVPQGAAFLVAQNSYGYDRNPSVAMDPDGNFVVVWDGYGYDSNASSYDNQGVFARVFNADGTARTDDILVNQTTINDQWQPAVAMDADGNFVVAWEGYGSVYSYDGQGIFFRRFDLDGNSLSSERRANSFATGGQTNPSVAMDKDGDFVIAWSSQYTSSYAYIALQKFDNDGRRVYSSNLIPGYEASSIFRDQRNPSVAIDDDGDFVVVWNEFAYDYYYGLGYTSAYMIRGRRFNASLEPQGPTFEIHAADFDPYYFNYNKPSVAMDADGDFVVAFGAYMLVASSVYGSANYRGDAFVRRYDAQGNAQGPAVQINRGADRWNWQPVVAMDKDGDFVAVFSRDPVGSDNFITMQMFEGNNAPTTSGIPDQTMDEDDLPRIINLTAFFSDAEDGSGGLIYSVVGNTNAALVVPGISGNNLGLALIPDAFGTADITIRATDKDGLWVEDTFTLTVNDVPETGPTIITRTKKERGCAADSTGAAPWGLLAVFAMLLGSLRGLVRRRQS